MIADPCCGKCRTPSGICTTRRSCEHHQIVAIKQRIEDKRPIIQYRDKTGDTAASRADRSLRRKQRTPR